MTRSGGCGRCAAWLLALAAASAASGAAEADGGSGLQLHVASPDWRDQVIYFLMTDRFDDGDPANNDQGAGEYDPADPAKFSGGDLRGVQRRLDYIQGLGATAVWITPPVANQWWQPATQFSGYHGYWAENFDAVDAHLGTLEDYQALSDALHRRGMFLVQDIVLNHVGNYFSCSEPARAGASCAGYRQLPDSRGRVAPTGLPFNRNDPRKAADRRSSAYHWTPDVRDYTDPLQEKTFQMAGLDDLDTENPTVRRALRASYGRWIKAVGVDAFRVDTAFYVPPRTFADFLHSADSKAPGMARVAAATGRSRFHVFGEGFAVDRPFEDAASRRIRAYMGPDQLPGMLNFPLYGSLLDVFARGQPSAVLAHRIGSLQALFEHPQLLPSFVDNHDVDRYLATGDRAGLRLTLLAIFTLPGIPTIYYGTEQGFTQPRQAMFAGGVGSGGVDHFDAAAPLYRDIADLAALRRALPVLSRGMPEVLHANAARAGAIAWRMRGADGNQALVLINSATHPVLLDALDSGLAAGFEWRRRLSVPRAAPGIATRLPARSSVSMPPRSAAVYERVSVPVTAAAPKPATATALAAPEVVVQPSGDLRLTGTARPDTTLQIVVDGDLGGATAVRAAADGRFTALLDTSAMLDAQVEHQLVVWDPRAREAGPRRAFKVRRHWQLLAEMADPAGDDHGRNGQYVYPLDASWRAHRQADIRGVRVFGSGGALRIEVQMGTITRLWNPAQGFDHVALTLFLGWADADPASGVPQMPQQGGVLPAGMRWQRRLRSHGWSNVMFSADGADAGREGTPLTPGALLETDPARGVIRYTLPASALGGRKDLRGLQVYLNSWDYDGGYRALDAAAGAHAFGGRQHTTDPLLMDETAVIELP